MESVITSKRPPSSQSLDYTKSAHSYRCKELSKSESTGFAPLFRSNSSARLFPQDGKVNVSIQNIEKPCGSTLET